MSRNGLAAGLAVIRDAAWMTPARACAYRNILLVLTPLAAIGWVSLASAGIDLYGKPIGADFISFWTASNIALSGAPSQVYQVSAHWAAQRALFHGAPLNYTAFFYPPVYLLICLPLALLPYIWSLVSWLGITGFAYWRVIRALAGQRGMALTALAFPAAYWNVMHGQNGFLTTALFGGALLAAETRPIVAGICFGCLAYKPHLAAVVPFALMAGRRWTTLAAAALTAAALCTVSVALFGWTTWQAFLADAPLAQAALEQNLVGDDKMQSVFAAVRLLGGSTTLAYWLHLTVAVTILSLLIYLSRSGSLRECVGAASATAALLVSPFVLGYDLALLAIPLVWIAREARQTEFLSWEKAVLLAAFILPLVSTMLAARLGLPVAPLVIVALFSVVLRRGLGTIRATQESRFVDWPATAAAPARIAYLYNDSVQTGVGETLS